MDIGTVVAWFALGISLVTFILSEGREKRRHAVSISVFESMATSGTLSDDNHSQIIIRNDGTHAVVIQGVGIAYGALWTVDRHRPEGWSVVHLAMSESLLEPSGQLTLDSPDPLVGVGIIGPVVRFVDATGTKWQKTPTSVVQMEKRKWKPRRRDIWFEQRGWFVRVDQALTQRAIRSNQKHPGRFPVLAVLIDFMWGWRPGPGPEGLQPLNAPFAWRYCVTGWASPNLDLQPRYGWRKENATSARLPQDSSK